MIKNYITKQRKQYKPAIFLFSLMPRSGTNYLNYLLSCCQGIIPSKNEEDPWIMYIKFMVQYQLQINNFMIKRFNHKDMNEIDMIALALNNKLCYLQEENNNHIVFKHTNLINFEHFNNIFPHEKVIILLRNGKDIAYSLSRCEWENRSEQEILNEYVFCKEKFDLINKNNNSLHIINYEDLVRNPVKEVERVLKRFNIKININKNKILNAPVIGSSQYKDNNGKVIWEPINKPNNFKPIGKGHAI